MEAKILPFRKPDRSRAVGPIVVSRCIVVIGGKLLMAQRGPERHHNPLMWEIPGGKSKPGETLAEAAARETLKECNAYVEVYGETKCVESRFMTNDPENRKIETHVSLADFDCGSVEVPEGSTEHINADWIAVRRLPELNIAYATLLGLQEFEYEIGQLVT